MSFFSIEEEKKCLTGSLTGKITINFSIDNTSFITVVYKGVLYMLEIKNILLHIDTTYWYNMYN